MSHCLLASIDSDEKSTVIQIILHLYASCYFIWLLLGHLFLIFSDTIIICQSPIFLIHLISSSLSFFFVNFYCSPNWAWLLFLQICLLFQSFSSPLELNFHMLDLVILFHRCLNFCVFCCLFQSALFIVLFILNNFFFKK